MLDPDVRQKYKKLRIRRDQVLKYIEGGELDLKKRLEELDKSRILLMTKIRRALVDIKVGDESERIKSNVQLRGFKSKLQEMDEEIHNTKILVKALPKELKEVDQQISGMEEKYGDEL